MKISGSTFDGSKQVIDGFYFENCVFTNCILEYRGGKLPSFVRCKLTSTQFTFSEHAANTIQLMHNMYHGGFQPVVEHIIESIKTKNAEKEEQK